jgi:hypothetical protein
MLDGGSETNWTTVQIKYRLAGQATHKFDLESIQCVSLYMKPSGTTANREGGLPGWEFFTVLRWLATYSSLEASTIRSFQARWAPCRWKPHGLVVGCEGFPASRDSALLAGRRVRAVAIRVPNGLPQIATTSR